jgi:hypothetical protein
MDLQRDYLDRCKSCDYNWGASYAWGVEVSLEKVTTPAIIDELSETDRYNLGYEHGKEGRKPRSGDEIYKTGWRDGKGDRELRNNQ